MTHDQHIASDPKLSAWVSASAGTGKTKVLTDRVLRLLVDGADPERILCITYTRAAAAEMESRISGELARWVTLDDAALEQTLTTLTGGTPPAKTVTRARRLFAQVLDAPARIRIQTIHSFCQSVLMRFPLEAGVPPHFSPIDDITARELLGQACAELFAVAGRPEHKASGDAIAALAVTISEKTLHELIAGIIGERRRFAEWLAGAPDEGRLHKALGLASGVDAETLLRAHFTYSATEEEALRQACAMLAEGEGKSDRVSCEAFAEWLEKREDVDAYLRLFLTQDNTPRKQLCTKALEKRHPTLKSTMLAEQGRAIAYHEARLTLTIAEMSAHVGALAAAILEFYRRLKERHGYLDYDDLILYTVRLLERPGIAPWVLYKLDGGLDHLLVDEAQDTAPEQWRIIGALAAEFFAGEGARTAKRTLFVVGDEKQSIYSFQGAEPQAFDAMQRHIAKRAADAGMDFRRVRLALSFRSTAPVLSAVDAVFALPQAREGLIFNESDISHEVSRIGMAGRVELWPLAEAADEESFPNWHVPENIISAQRPDVRLAREIAETIARWLKEKRLLSSQGRPVTPGDILVLVQRRGAFAEALLRALKRRSIPVAGADRLALTQHIAVEDCLSLARFLLLPQDDLALAEVLRSPFIGLSEERLFALAHRRGEKNLWQRLREEPACSEAETYLSGLLALTDYLAPYELFAHVLETLGGRRKLGERLGEEIGDPLNEFLTLALEYGRVHPPSLQGFLHWLEGGEIQIKRDMEKGRDEVRILTVHGAKGLQAPIVFLPDTVRTPPHEGGLLWNDAIPAMPLYSPAAALDDRHYRALKESRRAQAESEYRRLLYVAMTRAEDELYIAGWKSTKTPPEGCWYELVRSAAENWQQEGYRRVLTSEQSAAATVRRAEAQPQTTAMLPAWVKKSAAVEPVPSRPLAPSRLQLPAEGLSPYAAEARARGILIHRLLQYLPETTPAERPEILQRFLSRYGTMLPEAEQKRVASEVLAILDHPEFAPVFAPGSVAEASVAGIAGGRNATVIAGRIDRLAVLPRDVYIIDYKTNRRVPANDAQVPEAYLRQIRAYRALLSNIYPDRTIHCAILWTTGPTLMPLPEAMLKAFAA